MSRSYKHTPVNKISTGKKGKKIANRKLRRILQQLDYDIGNNCGYKLVIESWDIIDYRQYCPASAWDSDISEYNKCFIRK